VNDGGSTAPGPAEDGTDAALRGGNAAPACAFCGVVADEARPLSWSSAVEQGSTRWYCDTCTRAHVRDIEGKLDDTWWL